MQKKLYSISLDIYFCDNGDSNPDLEHGKLEFYP